MSTTNALDGLLAINNNNLTARWNFQDAVGSSVTSPGGTGNAVALTFSFLTEAPSYFSVTGFVPFSEVQKQAARDALLSVSHMIQVTFTEQPTNGVISFAMHPQPSAAAFAFFPSFSYTSTSPGNIITKVTVSDLAGDVWFNSNQNWVDKDFVPGGSGFGTMIHELGHALGLKHPFDDANVLDTSLDKTKYTVMSYTPHPNSLYRAVTETSPGSFSWTYEHIQPETLMPLDIEALQFLYGANNLFQAGNDSYTFETNRPFIKTIWDGGGKDTVSVSNFSLACTIDLQEGHYSSINIPSDALPPGVTETNTGIYDGTDNLAIAYGVTIENATGGTGNDLLIGNAVANLLTGEAGNDTLTGGSGKDTLEGGLGIDNLSGGLGNDTFVVDTASDLVTELTGQGVDLIRSLISYSLVDTDGVGSNGGNVENLTLIGSAAINGTGNALNNTLTGNAAANNLIGNSGSDKLVGGGGNDFLNGGQGSDHLTGGAKADRFIFLNASDSGLTAKTRDTITDFKASEGDKIDLSAIDADTGSSANDAFVGLSNGTSFGGSFATKASLFFDQTANILYANNDADVQADFSILLTGITNISLVNFVL